MTTKTAAMFAQPLYRNVQWFRGGPVFEAHTLVSLSLRLKDLLGPVTRVKKKKKHVCTSTEAVSRT